MGDKKKSMHKEQREKKHFSLDQHMRVIQAAGVTRRQKKRNLGLWLEKTAKGKQGRRIHPGANYREGKRLYQKARGVSARNTPEREGFCRQRELEIREGGHAKGQGESGIRMSIKLYL